MEFLLICNKTGDKIKSQPSVRIVERAAEQRGNTKKNVVSKEPFISRALVLFRNHFAGTDIFMQTYIHTTAPTHTYIYIYISRNLKYSLLYILHFFVITKFSSTLETQYYFRYFVRIFYSP